jgi:hypothetical protein
MSIKRLFKFGYQTDLDIAACDARLNDDYLFKQQKKGVYFLLAKKHWTLDIYRTKKGVVKLSVHWGRLSYFFRVRLAEENDKTIMNCPAVSAAGQFIQKSTLANSCYF